MYQLKKHKEELIIAIIKGNTNFNLSVSQTVRRVKKFHGAVVEEIGMNYKLNTVKKERIVLTKIEKV